MACSQSGTWILALNGNWLVATTPGAGALQYYTLRKDARLKLANLRTRPHTYVRSAGLLNRCTTLLLRTSAPAACGTQARLYFTQDAIEGSAANKQAHLFTSSATTSCSCPSLQLVWAGGGFPSVRQFC